MQPERPTPRAGVTAQVLHELKAAPVAYRHPALARHARGSAEGILITQDRLRSQTTTSGHHQIEKPQFRFFGFQPRSIEHEHTMREHAAIVARAVLVLAFAAPCHGATAYGLSIPAAGICAPAG